MGEPTVIDRLIDIERRLRELELSTGMGLSGTDQTIKGSHDRLDSLLGAGVATPGTTLVTNLNADLLDSLHAAASGANAHVLATGVSGEAQIDGLLTLLATLVFSGTSSGARIKFIPLKQINAGSAQPMFTITTPSTAGQTGGHYGCTVVTHAGRGGSTATATAGMLNISLFERAMREDDTGVTSTVLELAQTASAATDAATRNITDIALTVDDTDEDAVVVKINVTRSGSNAQEPYVSCWVLLVWEWFISAPVIAAA